MAPSRFQWHSKARAFAGEEQVARESGAAAALIPANPPATAIAALARTLGGTTAFCLSDHHVAGLDALGPDQFVTLTGGTSGVPKAVLRAQQSWIASFHTNARLFNYAPHDKIAVLGTLDHSLALYGVLEALHLGHDVHVLAELPPSQQTTCLRASGCNILYATPTQLRLLRADTNLPDMRIILCGGGALDTTTRTRMATLFPNAAIHVFYGAAETSFVTIGGPQTHSGAVGRTYPQVEIDIRDPDQDGIGTVWIKSPYLFTRYLSGDSPHTRRDGAWMTVGETGHLDASGDLYLRGRAGRTVTIADRSVHLDALETAINALPDMPACVLIARPDPLRGHHLIAVLEGPQSHKLRQSLLQHLKSGALETPRKIVFQNRLARLPSGKPDFARIATQVGAPS